ncbi:sulfurtransferase complex subunit TusD [Alteromonas aestuariivivens]|uniref:Sulfurtransferase complex subunit TusD n=1 Tax=Alteromonas aestuariivivens TaxID=1938339 RepID=A0A3D8M2Z0_9ALTE|nr:sulfurtransferase complex subunit TusD [Alteromonas aestuariivivens]RDV23925.1 sulfurtransferase complex subunit TusD [Alteromonas aestuariivivens]
MANYSVLITASPDQQANLTALAFCRGLVEAGHTVDHVFFYGSGVLTANRLQSPASDEINPYQQWCEWHKEFQSSMLVCVTAAAKRGIVDEQQAEQLALPAHTVSAPFEQVGLGEFFSRLHNCDHLVQF